MMFYYAYVSSKTIMMKFFETMQCTQWLSFNIAVPMLCPGHAFNHECYGSENDIVWSAIFQAYHTISGLQQGRRKFYFRSICFKVNRLSFIVKLHACIGLY